jgi:hypothetical protein
MRGRELAAPKRPLGSVPSTSHSGYVQTCSWLFESVQKMKVKLAWMGDQPLMI